MIRILRRFALLFTEPVFGETHRFLLLSILIGAFAGLLIVCFHIAIDFLSWFRGGFSGSLIGRLLSPTLGSVIAAGLVTTIFRSSRGSGVNQAKAALYIHDGYIPVSTVGGKFLACSISIGSGASLGPEDPALQMGAGTASFLGRLFRVSRDSMRMIAPVGAAAGIAAAFNTPITAVLFVMEEVISSWRAGVLGSIVLSAVSAVVVSRAFLGDDPLFHVPEFQLQHPGELLLYALIGVIGGLASAGFMRSIARLRRKLADFQPRRFYILPAAAGLFVGIVGIGFPQVMGAGYDAIDSALHGQYLANTLLLLAAAKLIVTVVCFAAEIPGGMFAPTLFIGAMIGGGVGALAATHLFFPFSPTGAYVLVGMGTMFAGVFRAPMTSIFMIFELSANYVIILPVMIANVIAYLISLSLQPVPFFQMLAQHEGIELPSVGRAETAIMQVEDAMQPPSPLLEISEMPRIYPDAPLDAAMRLLAENPQIVVVSRADRGRILGTVTLADVHRAYGIHDNCA